MPVAVLVSGAVTIIAVVVLLSIQRGKGPVQRQARKASPARLAVAVVVFLGVLVVLFVTPIGDTSSPIFLATKGALVVGMIVVARRNTKW